MSTLKTIKLQNPSGASSNIDLGTGGEVLIGSATTTGTASQTLQVTGGAYVSGSVGIGTTNPGQTLDIFGVTRVTQTNNGQNGLLVEMPLGVENTASGIRVRGYSPAIELIDKDSVQNWYIAIDDNVTNNFQIARGYGPGQNIPGVIEITPSDNVGIGITNPSEKLTVNGGFLIQNTNNAYMVLDSGKGATAGNQVAYIDIKLDGTLKGNIAINEAVSGTPLELNSAVSSNVVACIGGGDFLVGTTSTGAQVEIDTNNTFAGGDVGCGIRLYHTSSSLGSNNTLLGLNCATSATSNYRMIQLNSGTTRSSFGDAEFILRGDGTAFADGTWIGGGADYAEMFEWEDGNPDNEDRRGYSVSFVGNKIQIAEEGDEIIGVISGNPTVIGDAAWNKWTEKHLRDDFGSYITETHNVVEWTDEDGKQHSYEDWNLPEGIIVPDDATIKTHDDKGNPFTHRKLNPDYNPELEYVSREDRQEWDAVGLMGKLRLRKGQPVRNTWIKMRDISESVEEWLVR